MTQAGGSATIYGILYQALGASHWASTLSLKSELVLQDFASAQLIIEPRGGGGDVVVHNDGYRVVEQWKAKSDEGTWSVNALIKEVFPDLYRAVDHARMTDPVHYRFVSEGRAGRWTALKKLFDKIRVTAVPRDALAALDDTERHKFLSDSKMTEHEFFSWMIQRLREHKDVAEDTLDVTQQKLWHLIANFRFCPERTLEKVQAELDQLLLGAVDFREQVAEKRRELCGLVLELAAHGEVQISASEFLNLANIKAASFSEWTRLQSRLRDEVMHRIRGEWHYLAEYDVRSLPNWPANRAVLVLAGESGQGKTWQLAALAMTIVSSEGVATVATATGDADRDLQTAANVVWQSALDHDQELSLERLVKRRREVAPNANTPWLTVFIDDVLSIDEARRLVSRDWVGYEARLAISTLPSIARSLQSQFGELVHVVEVKDFNLLEAQEYLRRCGHDWGRLPSDVREILKRPLLARLYAELAGDEHWLPMHEYELFEAFWRRIRDARDQADHPGDLTWMRKLAGTVFDECLPYPWPQAALIDIGFPSDVQVRLERIGWLRRLDGDRVEVWHDRLLNWAVAEELVDRRKSGSLTSQELSEATAKLWGVSERRSGRYLGYVPLDVLWIIADSVSGLSAQLPDLIEAIEKSPGMPHQLDRFYGETLPTLGERSIPGIIERVKSARQGEYNRYPYLAASALVSIAISDNPAGAKCGRELISESDKNLQRIGMRVLAAAPDSSTLDRLWELHQGHCRAKDTEEFRSWYPLYEASFTALRTGVKQRPEWLESQIEAADPEKTPIHELAYLLASLEAEAGRRLWQRKKEVLFAKVPSQKQRCLARCIEHYRDETEVERLEKWLNISDDMLAATALMALSRIDPQRALRGMAAMKAFDLYACRNWWLDQLTARCPGETQAAIRELLLNDSENKWRLAGIYQGATHLMDESTLRVLLDDLGALVSARLAHPQDSIVNLIPALTLLEDVTSPHLLSIFESYAGSEFEKCLLEFAKLRLPRANLYKDHELDAVRSLLLKINGPGLTELVNAELDSNKHNRLDGVEKSLMRPDQLTRELMCSQVDYEECWDEQGYPLVQEQAAIMLAALGENAAVVHSIIRWGEPLRDLTDVRRGMAPMTDADLREALAAIHSGDDEQRTRGLFALSVSGRSDLAPLAIKVLKEADPVSDLANSAIWAIGDLGCGAEAAVALIKPQLEIKSHKYAAVMALARIGTRGAIVALENHLAKHGIADDQFHDDILAANLLLHRDSRSAVAAAVWKVFQTNEDWGCLPELFECLVELDEPGIYEWLVKQAYEPDGVVRTTGRRAAIIRALGKLDTEAAFRACESAILCGAADQLELAKTLVDLNSEGAIPALCKLASQGARAAVRYAAGNALRYVKRKEQVCEELKRLLQSQNPTERKVAVELTGWAGPDSMDTHSLRGALDDHAISVRSAACNALRRHELEAEARELLALLKLSHGARTWSLLDAIIQSASPHALQTDADPLFLGHAYPADDLPYWLYCKRRLDRRVKETEKELEDMDRKEE